MIEVIEFYNPLVLITEFYCKTKLFVICVCNPVFVVFIPAISVVFYKIFASSTVNLLFIYPIESFISDIL